MKFKMYSHPFQLTDGIKNYVRKKLSKSLSKAPSITEVVVTVSDINGPRGGEDKECKLQFSIAGKGRFVIRDTKSNMYRAIDSAVQRSEHALSRANSRKHKDRHLRHGRALKRSAWVKDEERGQAVTAQA